MLCFTLKHNARLISKMILSSPLREIPLTVTLGICSGVTGKMGMLVIIEVDCDVYCNFFSVFMMRSIDINTVRRTHAFKFLTYMQGTLELQQRRGTAALQV